MGLGQSSEFLSLSLPVQAKSDRRLMVTDTIIMPFNNNSKLNRGTRSVLLFYLYLWPSNHRNTER